MEKIQETLQQNFTEDLNSDLNAINAHIHKMQISNIWDILLPKTGNQSQEEETTMQEETEAPQPLKYISNILQILKKERFNLQGIEAKKLDQIFDGVYEGGNPYFHKIF